MTSAKKEGHGHLLVCLSTAPSNEKVIRTAATMADAFHSRFTALFVQTPDFAAATEADKARLREHCKLAEQLGACVETAYGEDIPYQIADFSRRSGVTRIVLGASTRTRKGLFRRPLLSEALLNYAPAAELYILPDRGTNTKYRPRRIRKISKRSIALNSMKSAAILLGATLLSLLFHYFGVTDSNIIMVYILGVLLTSVVTSHQIYSLVSSVSSVMIFNYLFTAPRYSLTAYGTGYPITFLVMFLTAYITGTFALRYKAQAKQSAINAYRTNVLFDTDRLLSKAKDKTEILRTAGEQIRKLLHRTIVIYAGEGDALGEPRWYCCAEQEVPSFDCETELAAVNRVQASGQSAGAGTDALPQAQFYYLPLRVNARSYGVVGIEASELPLEATEHGILMSILGEAALALENDTNAQEKEAAAILAKSEQLRANLLRTVSHDLRTPLTTISGNASNLLEKGDSFDAATKQQIYSDIYDDALWLINLVENLLYATRIEDGRMMLSAAPELVTEIIGEAMRHLSHKASEHLLRSCCSDDLLLVKADARLLVQVLMNLINNAIEYTPCGSTITVCAEQKGKQVEFSVADTGAGIPDAQKEQIFEKYYTGTNRIADNRRSLGLGLYLCKAIVEAHGGTLQVEDNHPTGAVFRFALPVEEVTVYE